MAYVVVDKKEQCCGCGACADACALSCIKMETDCEGFSYPVVEVSRCVSCGKCVAVCPISHARDAMHPSVDDVAYAYVAGGEEIVKSSSSGGAFSLIMDAFFTRHENAVVVGASFCEMAVCHSIADNRTDAEKFKKSKYVQSNTQGIFRKVKDLLATDRAVLFSGTPCQVAALKMYLGRDYDKLLTVDIVCHGVPSQKCFDEYLRELEKKHSAKIVSVMFRYKRNFQGDKVNPRTLCLDFENGQSVNMDMSESEFLYAYYTGLIYRPSCAICSFANPNRVGDITLADYWGIEEIHPELNSLRGVSLVRFNTEKGSFLKELFQSAGLFLETSWKFACAKNYQLTFPATPHRNRKLFFRLRAKGVPFCENVVRCKRPEPILKRAFRKLCRILRRLFKRK